MGRHLVIFHSFSIQRFSQTADETFQTILICDYITKWNELNIFHTIFTKIFVSDETMSAWDKHWGNNP